LLCEYKDGEQVFENPEYNTCYIDETSVQEQDLQHVSIYPNPAKGKVIIEGIQAAEVEVYNALGQLVKSERNSNEISVEGLAEGVYLVRIMDAEGKVYTNKITKR
jgi:hypothetical protein